MSDDFILCEAYKTAKAEETYLFVDKETGLKNLPEALLRQFPNPQLVTSFKLTADRSMARVEASKVMAEIRKQGYFLQMPPRNATFEDYYDEQAAIAEKNEKLKG